MRFVEEDEDRGQCTALPLLALQVDVLQRLCHQEPLGVCGQGLEPEGIDMAMELRHNGLEALEHPGQCVGVLVNEGTPHRVQGSLGNILIQAKCARAYRGHGVPRWPWWPSYTSRVMTNSAR